MSIAGLGRTVSRIHFGWWVLAATFIAMLAAAGVRSSFGVFVKPIEDEFGTDRTAVSLIASISVLMVGLMQPIVGQLADRFGSRWVIALSLLLSGIGIVGTSLAQQLWQIYVVYGVLVSGALGGAASVTATAVAARWFQARRGLAIGITMAGTSAGQLLLIPLAMQLTVTLGWRETYTLLGIGLAVIVFPIALLMIRSDPKDVGLRPFGASIDVTTAANRADERRTSVGQAFRSRDFWLLAGSYTVCGYTTAGLIATHLMPHAIEHGFDPVAAASTIGFMGAVNIVGTIGAGWISDRYGKKLPLATYYIVRGLAFLFLLSVTTIPQLALFGLVFGLSYIATVPPTAALTASLFGKRSVGSIMGWVYLSHQIGGALGSLAGGVIFDATGGYELAWVTAAILCFLASMAVFGIDERPFPRAQTAPVAS